MTTKTAVITVCIGEFFNQVAKLTHPLIFEYAEKIDADFICIDEKDDFPHWKKLSTIYNLLGKYARVIYLDTDLIVRNDCPNLFELVPKDRLGMFNEGQYTDRLASIREAVMEYQIDLVWNGEYYNSGVIVASRLHRNLFKLPKKIIPLGMFEQGYLNLQILKQKTKMYDSSHSFNHMSIMENITGENRLSSYIVHYAGYEKDHIIPTIENDLKIWKVSLDFVFPKNIFITVGGGMGDQVECEPVIRYLRENIYKYPDNIVVYSFWNRLFEHLGVMLIDDITRFDKSKYFELETMPDTKTIMWKVLVHTLSHTVDFASISTMHRTIPDFDKQIKYEIKEGDDEDVTSLLGEDYDFSRMILVHPGRGWPSKTFPVDYWQSIMDQLSKKFTIGVIGKHISDEQGYVGVTCPENGIDFRDLLSLEGLMYLISKCPLVITNDSAPAHLAGAFSNWILLLPTCKHPDHVLPYRNGSKRYKTRALYKKLTVDAIDSNPSRAREQTLDWVEGDIMDYLPEIDEVVNESKKIMEM